MLIKIVAMFRNLLISSFDATIRVKRAFHPALASRGFASHVFLVSTLVSMAVDAIRWLLSELSSTYTLIDGSMEPLFIS